MTVADIERMPVERRDRLVREASAEFARAGYEQASLNRIIRACGLSKSSFYHFVASKQALFDLVVDELRRAVAARMSIPKPDAFGGSRFWTTAEQLLGQLIETVATDASFATLGRIVYLSDVPADAHAPVQSIFRGVDAWMREVLLVGRRDGTVRDDLPAELQARLVLATLRTLDEWSVAHLDELAADAMRELAEAQLALLRRMLSTAPGEQSS